MTWRAAIRPYALSRRISVMYTDDEKMAVASEMTRIGILPGQRLPVPANLTSAADYLAFLRTIPTNAGISGFIAALSTRPDQTCR